MSATFDVISVVILLNLYLCFITRLRHSRKNVPNVSSIAQTSSFGSSSTQPFLLRSVYRSRAFLRTWEVQKRYLPIIRGARTPFPCVPRHFYHWFAYYSLVLNFSSTQNKKTLKLSEILFREYVNMRFSSNIKLCFKRSEQCS